MLAVAFMVPKEMDEVGNIKRTAFNLNEISETKNFELNDLECYLIKGTFDTVENLNSFLVKLRRNYIDFSKITLEDGKYIEVAIKIYDIELPVYKTVLNNGTLIQVKNRIEKQENVSVLMVKSSNLKDLLFETQAIIEEQF